MMALFCENSLGTLASSRIFDPSRTAMIFLLDSKHDSTDTVYFQKTTTDYNRKYETTFIELNLSVHICIVSKSQNFFIRFSMTLF